jgi:hypothetical protein
MSECVKIEIADIKIKENFDNYGAFYISLRL